MRVPPEAEQKLHAAVRMTLEALLVIQGDSEERNEDLAERLAAVIENNQSLRRRLDAMQDVAHTRQAEIEALQRRVVELEDLNADLRQALTRPVDENRPFRDLDRLMRTPPTRKNGIRVT